MISVVLATHNEAANIKRCLDSVSEFADEIVVVDGNSTDKTREIAKKLDARVIKTTNKPNFHINKQMAMDKAKGELVLQLDADEVVDQELGAFIKNIHSQVVKKNYTGPVAWYLKRKNLFMGHFFKKSGQYPDPLIRLYINGKTWLPKKDIHEQMQVKGETSWAEGHLIHYANPTFKDYLRKWDTYTTFKAHQLEDANLQISLPTGLKYLIWLPAKTFFLIFLRHKGFVDGAAGLIFAIMSGLHHSMAYLKLWEIKQGKKNDD
jgi:glycosyltransferase involved in cell wall biosynthesis